MNKKGIMKRARIGCLIIAIDHMCPELYMLIRESVFSLTHGGAEFVWGKAPWVMHITPSLHTDEVISKVLTVMDVVTLGLFKYL